MVRFSYVWCGRVKYSSPNSRTSDCVAEWTSFRLKKDVKLVGWEAPTPRRVMDPFWKRSPVPMGTVLASVRFKVPPDWRRVRMGAVCSAGWSSWGRRQAKERGMVVRRLRDFILVVFLELQEEETGRQTCEEGVGEEETRRAWALWC